MMRDLVYHHLYRPEGIARWLESPDSPKRKEYLQRFYTRYQGKSAQQAIEMVSQRVLGNAARQTMLYRAIFPNRTVEQLQEYLTARLSKAALEGEDIQALAGSLSNYTP